MSGNAVSASLRPFVVVPTVTWDSATGAVAASLSSGDLLVTKITSVSWAQRKATLSRSTGKYYFEILLESIVTSGAAATGLIPSTFSATQYAGQAAGDLGVVVTGPGANIEFRNNASVVTSGIGTGSTGDVISLAIDMDAKRLWLRKNAGSWYGSTAMLGAAAVVGDPAAGTNGRPYTPSGPFFPAASVWRNTAPGDQIRGRFRTADFTQAVPAGFSPWGG